MTWQSRGKKLAFFHLIICIFLIKDLITFHFLWTWKTGEQHTFEDEQGLPLGLCRRWHLGRRQQDHRRSPRTCQDLASSSGNWTSSRPAGLQRPRVQTLARCQSYRIVGLGTDEIITVSESKNQNSLYDNFRVSSLVWTPKPQCPYNKHPSKPKFYNIFLANLQLKDCFLVNCSLSKQNSSLNVHENVF